MDNYLNDLDIIIDALCIMGSGRHEEALQSHLKARGVNIQCVPALDEAVAAILEWERSWDLIFIDSDLDDEGVLAFFQLTRENGMDVPVIALYDGTWGGRQSILLRMGAFDAFPKDIDRWNAEVYIDRAIGQATIVKKLVALSRTDHVTGLFNRHYLRESLDREMRRAARTGKPLTVALLDIDNFKAYNDSNGHVAGDRALRQVADTLLKSIRTGMDSAFRFGGDEFFLILSETDLKTAETTIKRILRKLHRGVSASLSFSVGLSLLDSCEDMEAFINAADQAMYSAKDAGGGRIVAVVCREEPHQEIMSF